jgi:GNAT superfamily N-acetyltransferase
MKIRLAQRSDQQAIFQLWQALMDEQHALDPRFAMADDAPKRWHNDFGDWITSHDLQIWVAEIEDQIVGFISAMRTFPPPMHQPQSMVYLQEMYVLPPLRRQGIGQKLADAALSWSRNIGATQIQMGILALNKNSLRFWEQQAAIAFSITATISINQNQGENQGKNQDRNLLEGKSNM